MAALHVLCAALVVLAYVPACSRAAHILVVFQMGAPSHWRLGRTLTKALHARGHRITAVTTFSEPGPPDNWTDVAVPNTMHLFSEISGSSGLFALGATNDFNFLLTLFRFGVRSCEIFLQNENVQRLFRSEEQFDLMIIGQFFGECFLPLAHKLRVPVVAFSTISPTAWMAGVVGSPSPYAYVPDTFLTLTDRMTFLQRVHNTIFGTYSKVGRELYYKPKLEEVFRRYLNYSATPTISDMESDTSLILSNSHVSMLFPRPLSPNFIEVGGMHVKPPKKLPQDLQNLLDDAKDGAVIFSLGSNLQSSKMPENKIKAFLEAFSKLKQTVLWKWEIDSLEGKSANLKTSKWLPQSDVLAHKNVRLLITHGGLLSITEAVHFGVPLIGVPFFGDQDFNVRQAERHGYALKLDFENITADTLLWALTEMLNNPRYSLRAKEVSRLYHDRPRPPLEEAVYWTEYVLRHQGAPHVRSAALRLSWYQLCLLDVIAALAAGVALALCLTVVTAKAAISRFSSTIQKMNIASGIVSGFKKEQ